jgi:hypothetical protein
LRTEAALRRLIALEGAGGPALAEQSRQLAAVHRRGRLIAGVSRWDASGVFFEMEMRSADVGGPSPKTLLILCAADLAFRLRWEILPLLDEGRPVVAAPYVESYVALGKAFGVSRRWLVDLFGFAPRPAEVYRASEAERPERGRKPRGYLEHAVDLLNQGTLIWNPAEVHARVAAYLQALERRGGCRRVPAATGEGA